MRRRRDVVGLDYLSSSFPWTFLIRQISYGDNRLIGKGHNSTETNEANQLTASLSGTARPRCTPLSSSRPTFKKPHIVKSTVAADKTPEIRMGELRFLHESASEAVAERDSTATGPLPGPASAESREFCAYNKTRGSLLGVEVEVADFSPASLESRLPALTPQSGIALWIVPFRGLSPTSVRVPLDLLYLDGNNAVIDVVEFFPIGRVSASSRPAASVLALPADTITDLGICPGDQLIFCPHEEMKRRLRNLSNGGAGDRGTQTSALSADQPGPAVEAPSSQAGPKEFEPAKNWLQRIFKRGPRELRKARREPTSGIVAYFFTGGGPAAHLIRDISSRGIYIFTEERWYLGTVIRVTISDRHKPAAQHSITVNAKVVRWGNDGVGLEFVLMEDNNRRSSRPELGDPVASVSRAVVKQFLERVNTTRI